MDGTLVTTWLALAALASLGIAGIVRPGWGFMLGSRWQFKDPPVPSEAALVIARVGSVILLVSTLAAAGGVIWLERQRDWREARHERCEELLAEFDRITEFKPVQGIVTNPGDVYLFAEELGVEAEIVVGHVGEAVRVTDPEFVDGDHRELFDLTAFGGFCRP